MMILDLWFGLRSIDDWNRSLTESWVSTISPRPTAWKEEKHWSTKRQSN